MNHTRERETCQSCLPISMGNVRIFEREKRSVPDLPGRACYRERGLCLLGLLIFLKRPLTCCTVALSGFRPRCATRGGEQLSVIFNHQHARGSVGCGHHSTAFLSEAPTESPGVYTVPLTETRGSACASRVPHQRRSSLRRGLSGVRHPRPRARAWLTACLGEP